MPDTNSNDFPWSSILFDTVGFFWGFIIGGLTGVFGNWMYDKFKSWSRKNPELSVTTTPLGAYFQGTASQGNKQQILETLCKAIPDPKNKIIQVTIDERKSAKSASALLRP